VGEAIEIMLSLLKEDRLTEEYKFAEEVKRSVEIGLKGELKREGY
jgi:hypothetical protein